MLLLQIIRPIKCQSRNHPRLLLVNYQQITSKPRTITGHGTYSTSPREDPLGVSGGQWSGWTVAWEGEGQTGQQGLGRTPWVLPRDHEAGHEQRLPILTECSPISTDLSRLSWDFLLLPRVLLDNLATCDSRVLLGITTNSRVF